MQAKLVFNSSKNQIKRFFTTENTLIIVLILTSLAIRYFALPYVTGDYTTFLEKWWNEIKNVGIDKAFGRKINGNADYFYPYLYLLGLGTLTKINPLYGVKVISIIFEYFLAFTVFKMIRKLRPNQKYLALIGSLGFLFLPTVIANGSVWGQCDVIYSYFSILSLFLFMKKDNYWGTFAYAISFCFKLQAIFIFPVIILILIKDNWQRLWNLLLIPIVYLMFSIPAVIQGRPIFEVLTIYAGQAGQYPNLNYNGMGFASLMSASGYGENKFFIYDYFGNEIGSTTINDLMAKIFTLATFGITVIGFLTLLKYVKNLNNELIIKISLAFAFIVPYFLPRMHERYWFFADVLSFIYVLLNPKKWLVALVIILNSFITYVYYLTSNYERIFLHSWLAIFAILPIYMIVKDIFDDVRNQNIEIKAENNDQKVEA
jgi:Gpi18-like mannosyltransferase